MRRNGRDVGKAGKTVERQAPLCVCEIERYKEGGAGASSPMLAMPTQPLRLGEGRRGSRSS